jgi:CDP-diacylglycerol--serine O-phosphatidyltransferase
LKKGIYILPNMLTLIGMFFGFLSIVATMKGNYIHAAWAIVIANIFDGLDGFVARATGSSSRFGVELDSLSDLIAFGVAPAVMLYRWSLQDFGRIGWAFSFFFLACGALRLARFNIQTSPGQSKAFTGMPIPAAATIMASVVIFHYQFHDYPPEKNLFILFLTGLTSLLMVSTLRFHGLKEINLRSRRPLWFLLGFILIMLVIVVHPPVALFVFAMAYLIIGIIENIFLFFKKRRKVHEENKGL